MKSLTPILRERTSLLISHRLAGLGAFDQILVLQRGRIAERGTHHELLQARGRYHRMYKLQRRTDALEAPSSGA
jgi:ABC-type multidrug transport system fused ATPase/permease subunit